MTATTEYGFCHLSDKLTFRGNEESIAPSFSHRRYVVLVLVLVLVPYKWMRLYEIGVHPRNRILYFMSNMLLEQINKRIKIKILKIFNLIFFKFILLSNLN